jgi:hypothetical protein
MTTREELVAKQKAEVERLTAELAKAIEDGDERAEAWARQDLAAAQSLARLIHKG